MDSDDGSLRALSARFPLSGAVRWIGLRPARRAMISVVDTAEAVVGYGLVGDRYSHDGNRQVTLIQAEHLAAVASLLGIAEVDPALVRRNVVVAGLNLLALKNRRFRAGTALLDTTGTCEPCSRMEEALGFGGYNALRGHGGISARVVQSGYVRVGDAVAVLVE